MKNSNIKQWPICPNLHAQRARDFEDWCRIQKVNEQTIGSEAFNAVKKWFYDNNIEDVKFNK